MLAIVPTVFVAGISLSIALYLGMRDDIGRMALSKHDHDLSPQLQNDIDKLEFRLDRIVLATETSGDVFVLKSPNVISRGSPAPVGAGLEQQEK